MWRLLVYSLFLCIVILAVHHPSVAQTNDSALRLVNVTPEGRISFYDYSETEGIQLVGSLPRRFAFESMDGQAEWLLLGQRSLAGSPDGRHIAFTAQRGKEAALFIYDPANNNLTQKPIVSYWLIPHWSPDSEAIFLQVPNYYFGPMPIPDSYVYDLVAESLFRVGSRAHMGIAKWTPDADALIYPGSCEPSVCSLFYRNLYLVNRDGTKPRPLSDLDTQLPVENRPDYFEICNVAWSESARRWYYEVGCSKLGDWPKDYVYSASENDNNRLEVDFSSLYSSLQADYIDVIKVAADSDWVFISLQLAFFLKDTDIRYDNWRVVRLTNSNTVETVYERLAPGWDRGFAEQLETAVLSPDGDQIALVGSRNFTVASIATGTQLHEVDTQETGVICDPQWTNDQTFVYVKGGSLCYDIQYSAFKTVWQFDVETGNLMNLTKDLPGASWLLDAAS